MNSTDNFVSPDKVVTKRTSTDLPQQTILSMFTKLKFRSDRSLRQLIVLTVGVFAFFSVLKPSVFLTALNFQSIGFALAEVVILAFGVTVAMLTGGIDLSVVSTANLCAFAAVGTMTHFGGSIGAILLGLVCGLFVACVCGAINGLLIGYLGVPPILATLGTLQLFNGVAVGVRDGKPLTNLPQSFVNVGAAKPLGIPSPLILLVLLTGAMSFLLARSRLGLRLKLLGDNPTAARYAGMPNGRLLICTYIISAVLASIAGLIIASRNASVSADFGQSYLLLAIVVTILAGVNTEGGFAAIGSVALAGVCLQMVSSGLNSLNQSPFVYLIVQGVIVLAVIATNLRRGH